MTISDVDLQLGPEPEPTICEKCGEAIPFGHWPFCPHGSLVPQSAQHFDPVVYHVNAEGKVRFPGAHNAPLPTGYERRELKTIGEVRAFQRRINLEEGAKIRAQVEEQCHWLETVEAANRGDLRQAMARMSPRGRAFAELAIAIHNNIRPQSKEAGFYIEPFEQDSSNREAYRDATTGWRPKRS